MSKQPEVGSWDVGVTKCPGNGFHGFAVADQALDGVHIENWFGDHRETEEEALQDAWNHMQEIKKQLYELGAEVNILDAHTVN